MRELIGTVFCDRGQQVFHQKRDCLRRQRVGDGLVPEWRDHFHGVIQRAGPPQPVGVSSVNSRVVDDGSGLQAWIGYTLFHASTVVGNTAT